MNAHLRRPLPGSESRLTPRESGFSGDHVGAALFHLYLHLAGLAPDDAAECIESALNAAADAAAGSDMRLSLYEGILGYAWMVEHLSRVAPVGDSELSAELDEAVRAALDDDIPDDLITGAVGFGMYALERRENAPEASEAIVSRVIATLGRQARPVDGGITWPAHRNSLPSNARDEAGTVSLVSLAHGVPGIVAFLARAHAEGANEDAARLAEGALAWLQTQRHAEPSPAWFDHVIGPGSAAFRGPSRLAWCYGDLSAAMAFGLAGAVFERHDWMETSARIARAAAARERNASGVHDAGLCHGAAGVAHLLHTLWILTGDDSLCDAAIRWYGTTLDIADTDAGFRSFWPGDDAWREDRSFLTGSSGVGLALLSAISPVPPLWSRLLLTSLS
ncbi:MAG TPA: lanthionine synthetase LanC family protein [Thermoanaerobaculia bacterium]|nr:lanthionine synthetase LanC family protein [Thermoanaerobaculia bacterium]